MRTERIAALAAVSAVVLTAGVLGALALRDSTCGTCAEKRKMRWTAKPDRSEAANTAMTRMINEIRPKARVTPEDARYLLDQVASGPDPGVRGFAAGLLPELIRDGQLTDTESKDAVRTLLVSWLEDADWSNRSQAVWGLFRAGFHGDPEILRQMRALLDDSNELVRTSARNVFSKIEMQGK